MSWNNKYSQKKGEEGGSTDLNIGSLPLSSARNYMFQKQSQLAAVASAETTLQMSH